MNILNKEFECGKPLTATELNAITHKVDEIIGYLNNNPIPNSSDISNISDLISFDPNTGELKIGEETYKIQGDD